MQKLKEVYINIGTEKACCFIINSKHLMNTLQRFPLLYYAIEEGNLCAKQGYYSAGILAFSQVIKQFNIKEPNERHLVAHKMLLEIPRKTNYNKVVEEFKTIAREKYNNEILKVSNEKAYNEELCILWKNLMQKLT